MSTACVTCGLPRCKTLMSDWRKGLETSRNVRTSSVLCCHGPAITVSVPQGFLSTLLLGEVFWEFQSPFICSVGLAGRMKLRTWEWPQLLLLSFCVLRENILYSAQSSLRSELCFPLWTWWACTKYSQFAQKIFL